MSRLTIEEFTDLWEVVYAADVNPGRLGGEYPDPELEALFQRVWAVLDRIKASLETETE